MKAFRKIIAVPLIALCSLVFCHSAWALEPGDMVVPGGEAVGIRMNTAGAVVSGLSPVLGEAGEVFPAREAGLRPGDRIIAINGQPLESGTAFPELLSGPEDGPVELELIREGKELSLSVLPCRNREGVRQIGVWLRDSIGGIGTMTYTDPSTGDYGALGHGVSLPEAGELLEISVGVITSAEVGDVVPGTRGTPGELCGVPGEGRVLGSIEKNTPCGIFGRIRGPVSGRTPVPLAAGSEARLGKASILSTVDGRGPRSYTVEITRISREDEGNRQLTLTVTDPALLSVTGGIVQGMSGSPILQDGKLVGAVTHVLVNDPARGYGVLIENMLEAAG